MAYIGTSPSNGVRRRFVYEATASQTSFSGNDENGITLTYVDSLYLDVYQNGVKLKAGDDYTATTGTTVVLAVGASANDVVEMVAFDVFSVNDSVSASDGGNFAGNIGMGGTLAVTGVPTFTGRSVHSGGITVANAGQIGSVGDADAIAIASNGVVTFSQNTVGAGAMHHILTTDVSAGDASVIFNSTYITTAYRSYQIIISGYEPVTDATGLRLHPSIDNGSNFIAGITKGQIFLRVNNTSGNGFELEGADGYFTVGGGSLGNDDNETASFLVNLTGLTSAVHKKYVSYENVGKHSSQAYRWAGGAIIPTTSAINYIKLAPSSGNITAGRFSLYGIES